MGACNAKCTSTARLDGKTVVITGCNTGIGKECVKDFYLRGGNIIMACRNLDKANQALKDVTDECKLEPELGKIQTIELDLTSLQSIRDCAKKINECVEKIDILLNNAGVMMCPKSKTKDGFEMQFGTNHLGHFLFTLLLLPKIIASDSAPARIVNVSSMAHFGGTIKLNDLNWEKRTYSAMFAYAQSKLANIMFTKELARRLEEANITHVNTYALHPGVIRTELGRHMDTTYCRGFNTIYRNIAFKSPLQGAQTSIYCSVSDKCSKETGRYYMECHPSCCLWKANNVEDARKLWDESLRLVGLDANYNPFVASNSS